MPYTRKGETGEGLRKKNQASGGDPLEMIVARISGKDAQKLREYFRRSGYRSFSEGLRVVIRQVLRDRGLE